jgi:hypothetical protein
MFPGLPWKYVPEYSLHFFSLTGLGLFLLGMASIIIYIIQYIAHQRKA